MIRPSKPYLAVRKEILAHFDSARDKASAHKVQTYHGCYVEEKIREWLRSFLPKRYDVCAGYVVSQELKARKKHPHFDVIIYDALNSPVLWVEELSHNATQSRAIPAEFVLAVFEVKATLNTTTIEEALTHINELSDVSCKIDPPEERYRKFLPPSFFWGMIFVEIPSGTPSSKTICQKILQQSRIRNYYSSLILRKANQPAENVESGSLKLILGDSKVKEFGSLESVGLFLSDVKNENEKYEGVMSLWAPIEFVSFGFDLLALLNGTYRIGFVSSWYGMELPEDFEYDLSKKIKT